MPKVNSIHTQRGLSLVELMIALTIGLVLLLGITTLIVQQSQARDELEKSSRQIENGRYALQILHDEIQHAGFYGRYFNLPAPPAALPDPCLLTPLTGSPSIDEAMPLFVQGYNNVLPTSTFTCALDGVNAANNAANYLSGTDILVVRRAETSEVPVDNVNDGKIYLQSNTTSHQLGTGRVAAPFTLANNTTASTSIANLRGLSTQIYFISPCSVPAGTGKSCTGPNDDNGRPIPTLKRLELSAVGGSPGFVQTTLVEGIENMQLDYGIDANADGYPESYTLAPANTTDWSNVMTIRVNLLARNNDPTMGYIDTKTYTLGGASAVTPGGSYKRHVFSELVRAVNPSGRRAQQ